MAQKPTTKPASSKPAPGRAPTLPKAKIAEPEEQEESTPGFKKLTKEERQALSPEERAKHRDAYRAWREANGMRVAKDPRTFAFERLNRAHKTLKKILTLFSTDSANELERDLHAQVQRAIAEIGSARTDVNDLPSNWRSKGLVRRANIEVGAFVTLKTKQAEQYAPIYGSGSVQLEVKRIAGKFAVVKPTSGDGPQLAIEMTKLEIAKAAKEEARAAE